MLEKGSAECIDVRVWVLDLANFAQDARDGVEAFPGQIADVVVLDVSISETLQVHKPGVSISQNGVSVSRDHSA